MVGWMDQSWLLTGVDTR